MQNHEQARPALMLPPEFDGKGDPSGPHGVDVRIAITPLASPSEWLRDFGSIESSISSGAVPEHHEEERFWSASPAYPPSDGVSLPPPAIAVPPSPLRVWATRLLFAAIFGTALGLLAYEVWRTFLSTGSLAIAR
jgi:hypothetical protein